jgi:hypothetical protein
LSDRGGRLRRRESRADRMARYNRATSPKWTWARSATVVRR